MPSDLIAAGPVSVVELAHHVLPRLGQKGQYRLVTLLTSVVRVVALARPHLLPKERVHGGISVQGHRLQPHMGGFPHPLAHAPLHFQQLLGNLQMQRGQKPPKGALRRQAQDL